MTKLIDQNIPVLSINRLKNLIQGVKRKGRKMLTGIFLMMTVGVSIYAQAFGPSVLIEEVGDSSDPFTTYKITNTSTPQSTSLSLAYIEIPYAGQTGSIVTGEPGWNELYDGNKITLFSVSPLTNIQPGDHFFFDTTTTFNNRDLREYNIEYEGGDVTTGTIILPSAINEIPIVDAGSNKILDDVGTTITQLSGSVTDDGNPINGDLLTTWTLYSGPFTGVSFFNLNDLNTTVTLSESGVYVFQLSASDGDKTTSDTVTYTAPNVPVRLSRFRLE